MIDGGGSRNLYISSYEGDTSIKQHLTCLKVRSAKCLTAFSRAECSGLQPKVIICIERLFNG